MKEAAASVLPIVAAVLLLCFTASPIAPAPVLCFLIGTLMLIAGMGLFSLGAKASMSPIGTKIGTSLTKTKNLPVILTVSLCLGFAVTVAEPDLQVLAQTVPHINNTVLLTTVGVGVGLFLSVCMLRILTGIRLRWMLLGAYTLLFVLAAFADRSFLSVAFDAGGVTTGPMTVPFILALGMGVSNIRSDSKAESDSFGLVSLCSVGPVLAVLLLSFFYEGSGNVAGTVLADYRDTVSLGFAYLKAFPAYMKETAVALLPITVIFLLFQFFSLKLPLRNLAKIGIGVVYTYSGLVLFLTGVNVGFSPLGEMLGQTLAGSELKCLLIPFAMLLGWLIIGAEPAVKVLQAQIEEVSAGAIPKKAIKFSLSAAICLAMGLSMLRLLTGISVLWFLIPGYVTALALSFFVPDIYTAIAFDAGGVASGPMTAAFMLRFFIGAGTALGADILQNAFGVVALVAMMPLLSIQIVGFVYERKKTKTEHREQYGDFDIVELWEA